jgi:hypothetical protein
MLKWRNLECSGNHGAHRDAATMNSPKNDFAVHEFAYTARPPCSPCPLTRSFPLPHPSGQPSVALFRIHPDARLWLKAAEN